MTVSALGEIPLPPKSIGWEDVTWWFKDDQMLLVSSSEHANLALPLDQLPPEAVTRLMDHFRRLGPDKAPQV